VHAWVVLCLCWAGSLRAGYLTFDCMSLSCVQEAVIDTIVARVQGVPGDDRCVLMLGYTEQMEVGPSVAVCCSNSGLRLSMRVTWSGEGAKQACRLSRHADCVLYCLCHDVNWLPVPHLQPA
jgi:hypothetical protein